ncbi:MAG: SAM-dependent DNA methyltransferase [Bacteroidota bacterium]
MKNLSTVENNPIGAFFTPLHWATWVIAENNLFDRWIDGAVVLDPTAGEGNFLEAFLAVAIDRHIPLTNEMLGRLIGIEKEAKFVQKFFFKMKKSYSVNFPRGNFKNQDYILSKSTTKADIVVGNPPWRNFNELPLRYKEKVKPYYFRYHLVPNSKELLLGGSRIDIAALVIAKCLIENLKENGAAYFFMPLSILLNDSAHRPFRAYKLGGIDFSINRVFDFNNKPIFDGVAARFGLAEFQRDKKQRFPIPYFTFESGQWAKKFAKPAFHSNDPLSIGEEASSFQAFESFSKIEIPVESKPRQGVNTCGANQVFIFDSIIRLDRKTARVSNNINKNIDLPLRYLFPMVTKDNFGPAGIVPQRYVLLPYNVATGKPLEESEIKREPALHKYLVSQKSILQKRKGTLINVWISKGYWWALLGVGTYSFAAHKIIWEAYGKKTYAPKIFSGENRMCWQGNQSLHAYIPAGDRNTAVKILEQLQNPIVQLYLSSQRMQGTCNWAQPGRIGKLLRIMEDD